MVDKEILKAIEKQILHIVNVSGFGQITLHVQDGNVTKVNTSVSEHIRVLTNQKQQKTKY